MKTFRTIIMALFALILASALSMGVMAQEDETVTVNGAIEAINLNIVTINGQQIQFHPQDPTLTNLKVGDVIEVKGSTTVVDGTTVVVPNSIIIIIINPPGETPEATPEVTATPDPNATPEATVDPGSTLEVTPVVTAEPTPVVTAEPGEVITVTGVLAFVGGDIWVGGFKIAPSGAFNPSDYDEGDTVRITGVLLPDGITIQATSIVLVDDSDVVIIIEGPVEEIDLNLHIIVVYGFEFHIDASNPIWVGLEVGDIVHLIGDWDWDLDGSTIVLVVVNIVIVEPPPVIIVPGGGGGVPSGCWVNPGGNLVCPGRGRGRGSRGS